MLVEIRVERNVSESVRINIDSEEQLRTFVKNNELFDEIDYEGKKFEETVGEILWTEIAIIDEYGKDIKTFRIVPDHNTLEDALEEIVDRGEG